VDRRAHHRSIENHVRLALRIGAASFRVTQVLDYGRIRHRLRESRARRAANYDDGRIDRADSPRQPLTYAALFAGPAAAIADFREYLVSHKSPGERLREVDDRADSSTPPSTVPADFSIWQPRSVLLAAVGWRWAARRYAARTSIPGMMKCLEPPGFGWRFPHRAHPARGLRGGHRGRCWAISRKWPCVALRDLIRTELPRRRCAAAHRARHLLAILIGFACRRCFN